MPAGSNVIQNEPKDISAYIIQIGNGGFYFRNIRHIRFNDQDITCGLLGENGCVRNKIHRRRINKHTIIMLFYKFKQFIHSGGGNEFRRIRRDLSAGQDGEIQRNPGADRQ